MPNSTRSGHTRHSEDDLFLEPRENINSFASKIITFFEDTFKPTAKKQITNFFSLIIGIAVIGLVLTGAAIGLSAATSSLALPTLVISQFAFNPMGLALGSLIAFSAYSIGVHKPFMKVGAKIGEVFYHLLLGEPRTAMQVLAHTERNVREQVEDLASGVATGLTAIRVDLQTRVGGAHVLAATARTFIPGGPAAPAAHPQAGVFTPHTHELESESDSDLDTDADRPLTPRRLARFGPGDLV